MNVIAVLKKKKMEGESVNRRDSLDSRDMFFFLETYREECMILKILQIPHQTSFHRQ